MPSRLQKLFLECLLACRGYMLVLTGGNPGNCPYAWPAAVSPGTLPAGGGPHLLVGVRCSIPLQLR